MNQKTIQKKGKENKKGNGGLFKGRSICENQENKFSTLSWLNIFISDDVCKLFSNLNVEKVMEKLNVNEWGAKILLKLSKHGIKNKEIYELIKDCKEFNVVSKQNSFINGDIGKERYLAIHKLYFMDIDKCFEKEIFEEFLKLVLVSNKENAMKIGHYANAGVIDLKQYLDICNVDKKVFLEVIKRKVKPQKQENKLENLSVDKLVKDHNLTEFQAVILLNLIKNNLKDEDLIFKIKDMSKEKQKLLLSLTMEILSNDLFKKIIDGTDEQAKEAAKLIFLGIKDEEKFDQIFNNVSK